MSKRCPALRNAITADVSTTHDLSVNAGDAYTHIHFYTSHVHVRTLYCESQTAHLRDKKRYLNNCWEMLTVCCWEMLTAYGLTVAQTYHIDLEKAAHSTYALEAVGLWLSSMSADRH